MPKPKHHILYAFLLLGLFPAFQLSLMAQSNSHNKMGEMVDKFLSKSQSFDDIERLLTILEEDTYLYANKFEFVPSINPLNPNRLKRFSSEFGKRFHPIDKKEKTHLGIDISAKAGTPIHAAASGTVKSTVESNMGYGNQVIIEHRYGFKSRYAHMYLFVVKEGQVLKKGDIIGFVGSTGKSTANHIHFEISKNDIRIDPYPFCFLEF